MKLRRFNESMISQNSVSIEDLISMIESHHVVCYDRNDALERLEEIRDSVGRDVYFTPDDRDIYWNPEGEDGLEDIVVIFYKNKPVGFTLLDQNNYCCDVVVVRDVVCCVGYLEFSIFDRTINSWI